MADPGTGLERGREYYANDAWRDACEALSAADRSEPLGADDLERLATAAYLTGGEGRYLQTLERGHRAHLDAGDAPRAMRCAFWIGDEAMVGGHRRRALADRFRARLLRGDSRLSRRLRGAPRGDHATRRRVVRCAPGDQGGPASAASMRRTSRGRARRAIARGRSTRVAGELDAAEAAYLEASRRGRDPQPGLALLRLAHADQRDGSASSGRRAGFRLLLDTGTFHGLQDAEREAMGRAVSAVAAPDATMLLLAWPRRRRPLIRGVTLDEVKAAFAGWQVSAMGPSHFHTPKPVELVLRPGERWYRLRRIGNSG
ncbi:MAG TPA: hypothetical protein VK279_03055 [Solirubrobacteraceae bacterium]|nr:hypothetical protein [Solirubrobacteraceae bacterium]